MEIEKLYKLSLREHYYCDDPWYSCPKTEYGCANDAEPDECNCGADSHNKTANELFDKIKSKTPSWQDQPTKDGYYWLKCNGQKTIVQIITGIDKKQRVDTNDPNWLFEIEDFTAKWYGPINPPKED